VLFLVAVGAAHASYSFTPSLSAATLRVDAQGDVEIDWKQAGAPASLVVPPSGEVYRGKLAGADVSRPGPTGSVPDALVVRTTASGWSYALQRWQVAGGPVSYHFARWKGDSTQLRLKLAGPRLTGQALFQGRPVTGESATPAGRDVEIYVYVDCFGCSAAPNGWSPMLGLRPASDGSFAVYLRASWVGKRYRAEIAGPNSGETLAPDAVADVSSNG
jgi:hypothetical protein